MKIRTNEKGSVAISCLLIMLPVFEYYASFIKALDLASFLVIAYFIFFSFSGQMRSSWNCILLLGMYIILAMPVSIVAFKGEMLTGYSDAGQILLRVFKLTALFFIIFACGVYKKFNLKTAIKIMSLIVYVTTAFIIVQRISYSLGHEIINPLDRFVRYGREETVSQGASGFYRPSSLFFEPAHLAQYVLFYICLRLFDENRTKQNIFDSICGSVAIVCSTSGQGILMLVVLYIIFSFTYVNKNIFKTLGMLSLIILGSIFLYKFDFVAKAMNRIFTGDFESSAVSYRIGYGLDLFRSLPLALKVFGCGFGNVPVGVYFNGLEYVLNTLGVLGLLIVLLLLAANFLRVKFAGKVIVLVYFCLLCGAQMFSAISLSFTFNLLYHLRKGSVDISEKR